MDELYRDEYLVVRRVPGGDPTRWIVTFDNHSIGMGFDRPGFAEDYLRQRDISAIHMLGRGDDWYQYPSIAQAAAITRDALSGADRVVAYGSSMGGYAAIRFADAIGATAAIALSPQYSNDPLVVPWEDRWRQDALRIRWSEERREPIRCACRPLVAFDPTLTLDRRHADLIAADATCDLMAMPYTGHPVATYLSETGLLGRIVAEMLDGRCDMTTLRVAAKAARRRSSIYLGTLAERQPPARPALALRLGRMAVAQAPDAPLAMLSCARILTRVGQHDEALALHQRILTVVGPMPIYLVPFADALLAADRGADAIDVAREVVELMPLVAHLRNWLASILWMAGLRRQAIAEQKRAVALEPTARQYRNRLWRYRLPAAPLGVREWFSSGRRSSR